MALVFLRSFWAEARPVAPRGIAPWDRSLVLVLVPLVVLEALCRRGIELRAGHAVMGLALVVPLLFRRPHPFRAFFFSFVLAAAVPLARLLFGIEWTDLHFTAAILLLPYSLFRWGSGREACAGLVVVLALYALVLLRLHLAGDAVGGGVVMLLPVLLGATVRFREKARIRELDAARSNERVQIARELHDSVAHHLTAIALQAQGGIFVSERRPEAAVEVLHVIEDVAAKALGELRTMVSTLREDGAPALGPQAGITDIERLADGHESLPVEVAIEGDVSKVPTPVQIAVYRIAQESVTNARRHAERATAVVVAVRVGASSVDVTVTDDGRGRVSAAGEKLGFGLVGMGERASLLGGTLEAGPLPERGFRVAATFPLRRDER